MSGNSRFGLGPASEDMNNGPPNSTANSSGPSIGASSLVTDANSGLTGGPHLQRTASINNESYMRLPSSPMSSSNNFSGSSIVQQSRCPGQMRRGGTSSSSVNAMVMQEPGTNLIHAQKKLRLDFNPNDGHQQQLLHQMYQRQIPLQLSGHAIHSQQQMFPQHMMRGPMPHQLRPTQMQVQSLPALRQPSDSGLCARRLMKYMYHQRNHPHDNLIVYWRKFVVEYFAPQAKQRWCFSLYDHVGNNGLGAFPQVSKDAWKCDVCGTKAGKGFEASYEILARLNQVKFDRGVMDELLNLDAPMEYVLGSGMMMLECKKAVQVSVYDQLRVVREGHLRVIFTQDLKILSWDFCARKHEEFFSRRTLVPQVNQLLQVAHKYQTAVNESGSAGLSVPDLQTSCNMFVSAGHQLARCMEVQTLNDLGFSKRYVRCLQISEVVNSMKDLMDYSLNNKTGAIESLNAYSRQATAKLQAQRNMEQIMAMRNQPPIPSNYPYFQSNSLNPNMNPLLSRVSSFNTPSSPNPLPQPNPNLEQHMIQRLLQEMATNNKTAARADSSGPRALPAGHDGPSSGTTAVGPSRSNNSMKSAANNNNSSGSSSSFNEKPDALQDLQLPELETDILRELADSGFQW